MNEMKQSISIQQGSITKSIFVSLHFIKLKDNHGTHFVNIFDIYTFFWNTKETSLLKKTAFDYLS